MTSSHIKLEIDPEQERTPDPQQTEGQGITTIELNGNRLRVDGYFENVAPWIAEVELTDLQLAALRGTPAVG